MKKLEKDKHVSEDETQRAIGYSENHDNYIKKVDETVSIKKKS